MMPNSFSDWLHHDPKALISEELKMVYVILGRERGGREYDWELQMSRFFGQYQRLKTNDADKFNWVRKLDFELKIVQSIEGALDDGAFEAAVSEHHFDGPNLETWGDDEDLWTD
jgi:hypothetical protein